MCAVGEVTGVCVGCVVARATQCRSYFSIFVAALGTTGESCLRCPKIATPSPWHDIHESLYTVCDCASIQECQRPLDTHWLGRHRVFLVMINIPSASPARPGNRDDGAAVLRARGVPRLPSRQEVKTRDKDSSQRFTPPSARGRNFLQSRHKIGKFRPDGER